MPPAGRSRKDPGDIDKDPDDTGCILLDVRMPGMDGMELVQTLKKRHPDLPVVVVKMSDLALVFGAESKVTEIWPPESAMT